jgi:hypothetical protein
VRRRDSEKAVETLPKRVERTRSDVAKDDTQGTKRQRASKRCVLFLALRHVNAYTRRRPVTSGVLAFGLLYAVGAPSPTIAEPAPSPSPSPSPDPCDGASRLLATANRPTIGYSTCAVKQDTLVFELGYQNEVKGTAENGSVQSEVPQAFTRVGVANRFEFDIIGPNYIGTRAYTSSTPSLVQYGVADSGIGFKYELPPAGKFSMAFDGLYTGPNGSKFLTAGSATLTGNLDASFAMSPATSLGTTIAFSSTGAYAAGQRFQYGVTTPSFVLTTQIPNYYQFYAEYVLVSKVSPRNGARAFTDFGVQKLLGTRTEIDVEYGHAFTTIESLKFNYIGSGLVIQLW